ncbi:hypothetical protein [Bradyrhizobium sp. 5.13L]
MMAQTIDRLVVGMRFIMSELGIIQFQKLAHKTGIVVEMGLHTTGITVLFDGATRPTVLVRNYITPMSQ